MWFEVMLFCSAGIVLLKSQMQQCYPENKKADMHMAVWVAAPALFMLLFRRGYSIQGLLTGYLVIGGIVCCKRIAKYNDRAAGLGSVFGYLLKILTVMIVGIVILNYDTSTVGSEVVVYGEAVLLFFCISLLLLFSKQVEAYINKRGYGIRIHWLALIAPIFGFYIIERAFNTEFGQMPWKYGLGNLFWLGCVLCVFYCLLQRKKVSLIIFFTGCLLFGVANFYVSKFRGSPVMPSDLMSIGTAFQVAGGYEFKISGQVAESLLCWYAGIALVCCLPEMKSAKKYRQRVIAASLAVCICAGYLSNFDPQDKFGLKLDLWNVGGVYRQAGSVVGFTALLNQLKAEMPAGYSAQKADEIFQKSKSFVQNTGQSKEGRKPTVIALMVETFSDLNCLGEAVRKLG